jgi:hypothetical protein
MKGVCAMRKNEEDLGLNLADDVYGQICTYSAETDTYSTDGVGKTFGTSEEVHLDSIVLGNDLQK